MSLSEEDEFVDETDDEFVDEFREEVVLKSSKKRKLDKSQYLNSEQRKLGLERHEALKSELPTNVQANKQPRLGEGDLIDVETKAECRKREKQELAARVEARKQHDQRHKLRMQLADRWCVISGAQAIEQLGTAERVRVDAMVDLLTTPPPFAGTCPRNTDQEQLKALGAKFDRASKTWQAPDHATLLRLLEEMPSWTLCDVPATLQTDEAQQNLRDLCKHSQTLFATEPAKDSTQSSTQPTTERAQPSRFPTFSPGAWINELPDAAPSYGTLLQQLKQQVRDKAIDDDSEQETTRLAEYGLPAEAPLFFYKVKSAFGPRKTNSMASRLLRALLAKKTTVDALKIAWLDVRSGRVSHEEVLARLQRPSTNSQ
jgi:hypothetical protein